MRRTDKEFLLASVALVVVAMFIATGDPMEAGGDPFWDCRLLSEYERNEGSLSPGSELLGPYDGRERVESYICGGGIVKARIVPLEAPLQKQAPGR